MRLSNIFFAKFTSIFFTYTKYQIPRLRNESQLLEHPPFLIDRNQVNIVGVMIFLTIIDIDMVYGFEDGLFHNAPEVTGSNCLMQALSKRGFFQRSVNNERLHWFHCLCSKPEYKRKKFIKTRKCIHNNTVYTILYTLYISVIIVKKKK